MSLIRGKLRAAWRTKNGEMREGQASGTQETGPRRASKVDFLAAKSERKSGKNRVSGKNYKGR